MEKVLAVLRAHLFSFTKGPHMVARKADTTKVDSEDAVILHYPHCPFDKWKHRFLQMSSEPKPAFFEKFPFYTQSVERMQKCANFLDQDSPAVRRRIPAECEERSLKLFWDEWTRTQP